MNGQLEEEVLWLRQPLERESPPSRYAVLWPAVEFTALVFIQPKGEELQLDPFERAVLGAAANGLIEIKKQADFLNLNEEFVGHIHERLGERRLLDTRGRVLERSDPLLAPQTYVAIRLYQDHWTGLLWPRFVTEQWRRTLPVEMMQGRTSLMTGTTGAPVEVRAFRVSRPSSRPGAPTSDDAREAVKTWTRFRKRIRVGGFAVPQSGPIKLLPDSAQSVYLCCLNNQGRPGRPDVLDPFDGPTWAPFARSLVERSGQGQPLGRWLYGSESGGDAYVAQAEEDSLGGRIAALADRVETTSRRGWAQLWQDIESVGHEAIDALWAAGTENVEAIVLNQQSDQELIERACVSIGFHVTALPIPQDLRAVSGAGTGTLGERCAALLLRFRADVDGPLHHLATRCPDLFTLLNATADAKWGKGPVTGLMSALVALGESAAAAHFVSDDRRANRGEG